MSPRVAKRAGPATAVAGPARGTGRARIFFLFLDGVGVGRMDGTENPFFSMPLPGFESLLGGPMMSLGNSSRTTRRSSARPIDANLGIGGLPQSGTGQSAILTGENTAKIVGKHFGPYPHTSLRPVLAKKNIFSRISGIGRSPAYLNAFPRQYTEHLRAHPGRAGAISLAWRSGGGTLNGEAELAAGRALSSDFTAEGWGRLGYTGVPVISPRSAAGVALRSLDDHDFVFFEYYLTDHAGHGRSRSAAAEILAVLDAFVAAFLEGMDDDRHTLIVTSDHGNFEDLSTKRHTRNPVPFICAGAGHERLTAGVRDLTDIVPALLKYFSG